MLLELAKPDLSIRPTKPIRRKGDRRLLRNIRSTVLGQLPQNINAFFPSFIPEVNFEQTENIRTIEPGLMSYRDKSN